MHRCSDSLLVKKREDDNFLPDLSILISGRGKGFLNLLVILSNLFRKLNLINIFYINKKLFLNKFRKGLKKLQNVIEIQDLIKK